MSDKEDELVNKVAEKIVDSDFELGALYFLNAFKPLYLIGGELGHFFLAPYLTVLEGRGEEFLDTFEKKENIEKLLSKVEELSEEKHQKKLEEKKKRDEKVINFPELITNALRSIFGQKR
jgi:hypothetical protein